jgi:hypothetical protein
MAQNNVAPGWERTTIDGKAQYRQMAQSTALAPTAKPVNGSDLLAAWRQMADAHTAAIPRQAATIDGACDYSGRGSGLSSASELAERRKTSAMYLLSYAMMTGGTIAGLVGLAYVAGIVGDSATAFAAWVGLTGLASLSLAAWQHRRELSLTPESLESERIGADYSIAEIDAESRRILAEAHADSIRLAAQAQLEDATARRLAAQTATQAAMAAATRQIAQHETPQSTMKAALNYQKPLQAATTFARAELPVWTPESAQQAAESPTPAIVDGARRRLMDFVLSAYADGNLDGDGYLRKGITFPTSQRSDCTATERRQIADLLAQLPTPFAEYDGERKSWRVNRKRYPTAQDAITALGDTVTRDM